MQDIAASIGGAVIYAPDLEVCITAPKNRVQGILKIVFLIEDGNNYGNQWFHVSGAYLAGEMLLVRF